jgi:hypothetical protein
MRNEVEHGFLEVLHKLARSCNGKSASSVHSLLRRAKKTSRILYRGQSLFRNFEEIPRQKKRNEACTYFIILAEKKVDKVLLTTGSTNSSIFSTVNVSKERVGNVYSVPSKYELKTG